MALGKLAFLCLNTACIGSLGLLMLTMLLRANGTRRAERRLDEERAGNRGERGQFHYGSSYLFRQDHPYVEWMESDIPISRRRVEAEPEREMSYGP